MNSNKKLSYNVNAIVGKYIMPVTLVKKYDNFYEVHKLNYFMMYDHNMINYDITYNDLFSELGYPGIRRHCDRYEYDDRKMLKKQLCRKYILIKFSQIKSGLAGRLFNTLYHRYKPTNKYYMTFARIAEFFY